MLERRAELQRPQAQAGREARVRGGGEPAGQGARSAADTPRVVAARRGAAPAVAGGGGRAGHSSASIPRRQDARPQPRRRIDLRDDAAERAGGVLELAHLGGEPASPAIAFASSARSSAERTPSACRLASSRSCSRSAALTFASRNASFIFISPSRIRVLIVPSGTSSRSGDLDVRQPLEKRQLDRQPLDQGQLSSASFSRAARSFVSATRSGPSAGSEIRPNA